MSPANDNIGPQATKEETRRYAPLLLSIMETATPATIAAGMVAYTAAVAAASTAEHMVAGIYAAMTVADLHRAGTIESVLARGGDLYAV